MSTLATATAAASGATVTATVNGATVTVRVARDLTVALGDVLIVSQVGAQWFAVGRAYPTAPVPEYNNDLAPHPAPAVVSGTLVVSPTETRSHRAGFGWRTDSTDVIQGEYGGSGSHTGAAFYGTAPQSLTGAIVTSATVQVRRTGGPYAAIAATLRLVTETSRPAGAPTLTSTTTGPAMTLGDTSTFEVPVAWVQEMVDGTAGGLAIYNAAGPYLRFAGRGAWSPAFTLTIAWSRTT